MTTPLCSVVVISYNGRELLRRFLPSVLAQTYPALEVIVVDNASTDGSAEMLAAEFPQVRDVRSPRNEGTAEGSNIGARHAAGDYVFWLSNDMELEPRCLEYLVQTAESDERIGVVTCKMRRITADGEKLMVLDSVGGDLDVLGFPHARGIHEPDRGQLDYLADVFYSFGGAMLIRRSVLEQIGGYDPATFTLADDIDLCWRAQLAGYRIVADPRAVLYHRVSATLGTAFGRSQKRFWSERNTYRMLLKNYRAASLAWVLPVNLALSAAEMLFFCAIGRPSIAGGLLRALWWNIRHLPDTLRRRRAVQSARVVPDGEMRRRMRKVPRKLAILLNYLRTHDSDNWRQYLGESASARKASVR